MRALWGRAEREAGGVTTSEAGVVTMLDAEVRVGEDELVEDAVAEVVPDRESDGALEVSEAVLPRCVTALLGGTEVSGDSGLKAETKLPSTGAMVLAESLINQINPKQAKSVAVMIKGLILRLMI